MTENEAMDLDKLIVDANALAIEKETLARIFRGLRDYGNPKSTITSDAEKAQKEAEQYEQVAKLFEELKQYRAIGTIEEFKAIKSDGFTDHLLNMGYTKGINDGYAKAIEEFVSSLSNYINLNGADGKLEIEISEIEQIAEEMKGGGNIDN